MHRSRLSTLLIDTPLQEADASVAFWSDALGASTSSPPGEPQYISLRGAMPDITLAVQRVEAEARYHVDIETDYVDAEVTRLQDLGAVAVSSWQGCRTLRAPGGHLLCVIPVHSDLEDFNRSSKVWP